MATANDAAWARILAGSALRQELETQGWCELSADTLKALGAREPRLLVKWDTPSERPRPLAELGASLLPVRNGQYLVFRDEEQKIYHRLPSRLPPPRPFASQVDLSAFDTYPGAAMSEAQALDFAHLAGLFADFTGDSFLNLVLRGRLYSGKFGIDLPRLGRRAEVDQVQIEIDAGYEGRETLLLIEAKRGHRDHAHLRQLWYPYLSWRTRTRKRIVPVFFTYANGVAALTELRFTETFGEVETVRTRVYALDASPPPKVSLSALLAQTPAGEKAGQGAGIPFPQANDLDKWIDLLTLLALAPQPREAIASAFGMDGRQADYYANTGLYLGLMRREASGFALSPEGTDLAGLRTRGLRAEALLRRMLASPDLRYVFEAWLATELRAEVLAVPQLAQELARRTGLGPSTSRRRIEGVLRWLEWFADNLRLTV